MHELFVFWLHDRECSDVRIHLALFFLSPIESPSGSAAMNAVRMSGEMRGTRKWTFALGSKRVSLNAILNFAIFSENTVVFFFTLKKNPLR